MTVNAHLHIHMIWAQDRRGGIGVGNKLPWHISADLQNFKRITLGKPVLMGLNTWQSLPRKPLPKRRNIVLSPDKLEDVESYNSIESCLDQLRQDRVEDIFIIGGAIVYGSFYSLADELHITLVEKINEDIDVFFPIPFTAIQQDFQKVEELPLTDSATYTCWKRARQIPVSN